MYIPGAFAVDDPERLQAFLRRHSFATVVSATADGPFASRVPLLYDADRGPLGTLIGHVARANDHWRLGAETETLAIFDGPHAYVSPAWYEEPNVVPTWNYLSVHAAGRLRVRDDRAWLLEIVARMVDLYEAGRATPWRLSSQPDEFIERLLGAIVGFEIPIDRLEGKWKLSQNHTATRRRRVAAGLRAEGGPDALAIAEMMEARLAAESGGAEQR